MRYIWKASGGTINGNGAKTLWHFDKTAVGLYRATVTVEGPRNAPAQCSIQVFVEESDRSTSRRRDTGRSFLKRVDKEPPGYGLYSYLLLGSPPTDSNRNRYLVAIGAYLHSISEIDKLADYEDRAELNITLLPVEDAPTPGASPEWILAHYDYARSRFLLDKLPGDHARGPYVLSTLKPLGEITALSDQYLFQDLSIVPAAPPDLLYWWVQEFMAQAAQEHFRQERTASQIALRLRTTVAILAIGVPDVRQGLDTALAWIH